MIDIKDKEHVLAIMKVKHDNICELVAIKDGKIQLEMYRNGFKNGDTMNVMSVTKSVVSLLIGIAIDKGYIKSEDQKVLDFFPNYIVKRGEKTIYDVTLKHLLSMTAPYKYKSEPWTKVCSSNDWSIAALDILGGKKGITGEFKYSTLGIQILNAVIKNSSKMDVFDFANKFLFEPLGIEPRMPANAHNKDEQFEYLMSKKPQGNVWFADPTNIPTAGWGLSLSAVDMAKIGELCLNEGTYEGKKIISSDWIKKIFVPQFQCDFHYGNMRYGYLWWLVEKDIYAAIGDGGNVIYINKATNTVVAVNATFKPRVFDRVDFIKNEIEPIL